MFDAVILMAGQGLRSGLNINKVFYKINDIPLYHYSLNAFLNAKDCRNIILVVRPEDIKLLDHQENKRIKIVYGGLKRQDSVYNGVLSCEEQIILVHDSARPNININLINDIYEATKKYQAAFLGAAVVDTIRECHAGFYQKTLQRDDLWAVQTPQGFYQETYLSCSKKAQDESFYATDDIELIHKYSGIKAKLVESSANNLKVTNYNDFLIVEQLMKESKS